MTADQYYTYALCVKFHAVAPYIRALAMMKSWPLKRTGEQSRMLFSKTVVPMPAHTTLVGGTLQLVGWIPSCVDSSATLKQAASGGSGWALSAGDHVYRRQTGQLRRWVNGYADDF